MVAAPAADRSAMPPATRPSAFTTSRRPISPMEANRRAMRQALGDVRDRAWASPIRW